MSRILYKEKHFIQSQVEKFNAKKGLKKPIELEIQDSYQNMYDVVKNVPQSIELADRAMKAVGIKPSHKPIRGGTDGAFLASKGLACPKYFLLVAIISIVNTSWFLYRAWKRRFK